MRLLSSPLGVVRLRSGCAAEAGVDARAVVAVFGPGGDPRCRPGRWCGGGVRGEGRHAVWRSVPLCVVVLWRCPTLPQPVGCSTIGAAGLSFQVRNVAGRFPGAMTTTRLFVQHAAPPRCCLVGVWVDRGSYSGCGIVLLVGCFTQRVVGCLFSVGPLVPVGSRAPRGASTSGLSTR